MEGHNIETGTKKRRKNNLFNARGAGEKMVIPWKIMALDDENKLHELDPDDG